MSHIVLSVAVLVCLGTAAIGGVDHFARKAYAQGCKDQSEEIAGMVAQTAGEEAGNQFKELLNNMCEKKAHDLPLKEIL